jgi:hypothetical protein
MRSRQTADTRDESVAELLGLAEKLTATWSGLAATVVRPLREMVEAVAIPEKYPRQPAAPPCPR